MPNLILIILIKKIFLKWIYKHFSCREHLNNNYQNHIKIFTDGFVLDSLDSGTGFVIPDLKMQKSFCLGKGFSIFTSELYAILMTLDYICSIQLAIYIYTFFFFFFSFLSVLILCIEKLGLQNEKGYILWSKVFNTLYHVQGYWDWVLLGIFSSWFLLEWNIR